MESIEHNPTKNHKAISIILQEDGNYKAYAHKNDKDIEVRGVDPNTVLNMILTHN